MPDPKAGSEAKSSATAPQSQQKRFLLYAGLAVLVLLLVAASIYLVKSNKAPGQPPTPSGSREAETKENGEVLPQSRRDLSLDGAGETIWFGRDPFATPLKLTGIVTGGFGDDLAIIESGSAAYIVKVGDVVDEVWTVTKIGKDTVELKTADREIKLQLAARAIPEVVTKKDNSADDDGEEES